MGKILHNWNLDIRKLLLRKAYAALPQGGSLIVCETVIDDERRTRAHSLLASLNMLLQTDGGSEFTGAECASWMHEVAIRSHRHLPAWSALLGRDCAKIDAQPRGHAKSNRYRARGIASGCCDFPCWSIVAQNYFDEQNEQH